MSGRKGGLALSAGLLALAGCGGQGTTSPSPGSTPPVNNVQPIQVTSGPANNTVNGLYTSVTICVPGTSSCQTIDGVQVDTGSVGLRLLTSPVTLPLPPVNDWQRPPDRQLRHVRGLVLHLGTGRDRRRADGRREGGLGAHPAHRRRRLPRTRPPPAATAGRPPHTAAALSANGLLGVGVFRQDCGPACSGGASPAAAGVLQLLRARSARRRRVPAAASSRTRCGCSPRTTTACSSRCRPSPRRDAPHRLRALSSSASARRPTTASGPRGSTRPTTAGNFSTTFEGNVYSSSYLDTGSNGLFFLDSSNDRPPRVPGRRLGLLLPVFDGELLRHQRRAQRHLGAGSLQRGERGGALPHRQRGAQQPGRTGHRTVRLGAAVLLRPQDVRRDRRPESRGQLGSLLGVLTGPSRDLDFPGGGP